MIWVLAARALAYEELTADFDDGDLSAWTVVDGEWAIVDGVLSGAGLDVGPDLLFFSAELLGVTSMSTQIEYDNGGSVGLVYAVDDSGAWCAAVYGDGDVYLVSSDAGEVLQHDGPSARGDDSTLEITVSEGYLEMYHDGDFQFSGPGSCAVTEPNGYIGLLTLAGSETVGIDEVAVDWAGPDADGDGSEDADDCDDEDATIHPGADDEWYDGIDHDCAGNDDYDRDGDGYTVDEDCDDTDRNAYPGNIDLWYDGVDSDCSGNDDFDADGDGYPVEEDCNDGDPEIFPGSTATEDDGEDRDCDGKVEPTPGGDSGGDGGGDDSGDSGGGDKLPTGTCAGCSPGSPLPVGWLLALGLLAARRR